MHSHTDIKNVGVLAHVDAGKTTLTERLLFVAGASEYVGEVDEGTSVSDWMPQEQARGISICSAAVRLGWRGTALNLIDTPGHIDFTAEVEGSLQALDSVVLVVSAVEGVQPQTELIWRQLERQEVPAIAFINKMDREGKPPELLLEEVQERLDVQVVQLQVPWMDEEAFLGVVDLVHGEGWRLFHGGASERVPWDRLPPDVCALAELHHEELVDALTRCSDELLEMALELDRLPAEAVQRALRQALARRLLLPVMWGAAKPSMGVDLLLDMIVSIAPSPAPTGSNGSGFSGLVFKVQRLPRWGRAAFMRVTSGAVRAGAALRGARGGAELVDWRAFHVHGADLEPVEVVQAGDVVALLGLDGVIAGDKLTQGEAATDSAALRLPEPVLMVAIEGEEEAHEAMIRAGLARLLEEDRSLTLGRDPQTGQTLLGGMGELHLNVAVERLQADLNISVVQGRPRVSCRYTPRGEASGFASVAGRGEAGEIALEVDVLVRPLARGAGVQVELPSSLDVGVAVTLRAAVSDLERAQGRLEHPICDALIQFRRAPPNLVGEAILPLRACSVAAIQRAMESAGLLLLEPWMQLTVGVPLDDTGAILGDLQARGGEIRAIHTQGQRQQVSASAPMSALFGYASELRSLTQGRGEVLMRPDVFRPSIGGRS